MSKFIVSSAALLKQLQRISGVVVNNPTVPILENIHFAVVGGYLRLTASDLETTLSVRVAVESRQDVTVCVPARILLDTLKNLPDQPITCTVDEEEHTFVISSANGRYSTSTEDAREWPRTPILNTEALELPGSVLKRAVALTQFAVSTDELRPAMTGVLVEVEGSSLTFVATDGHRLLRYRRTDVGFPGVPAKHIIPRKPWALLGKSLPADALVQVRFGTGNVVFEADGLTLTTRLIDERYPDYENVIPIDSPFVLTLNRLELLASIRRVGSYANGTTHQLRLALSGAEVKVTAENLDFQREASETLVGQYDGEDLEIGFSARFLNELVGALDSEEVRLALTNPNRAGLLTPAVQAAGEDVLMLVMPVMLNPYK